MSEKLICGFEKDQIFHLYAYLVAYENSGVKKYHTNKQMYEDHPELSDMESIFKSIQCIEVKAEKIKTIDIDSLQNQLYQSKNKNNHLLSFLSHLRNSIAHGSTKEKKGAVLFTDNKRICTIGCVDLEIIIKITKILNIINQ